MARVYPKKKLGQHFLKDRSIAIKISEALAGTGCQSVLEIGPGTGILTEYLLKRGFEDFHVIEIDNESVHFLKNRYPGFSNIIAGDFLTFDPDEYFSDKIALIGNFPYNISSQIFFRILEKRDKVAEVVCMVQKEVAERICASPGSRTYGILSVLLQAFYNTEYLFSVSNDRFTPPPKVQSGVIRMTRNAILRLGCDEELFLKVVKGCFNQRRKTIRNSLRSAFGPLSADHPYLSLRPEQLSVGQFEVLTNWVGQIAERSE